jgi:hypothetical protein
LSALDDNWRGPHSVLDNISLRIKKMPTHVSRALLKEQLPRQSLWQRRPRRPFSPPAPRRQISRILIWDAACSIRAAKEAPKHKDYILPLIFTKRLCDVFDDELNRIAAEVGSRKKAFHSPRWIARRPVPGKAIVRFYFPSCRTMPRARSSQNSNSSASSGFEAKLSLAERLADSRPPLQTTPGA